MAFQRNRSSRRSRRTDTSDKTQKDPVVIQQKPTEEVAEAIRAIPKKPAPAPVVKETQPKSKYGELEFFTEQFIDDLVKIPADLMFYLSNQDKAYKAMRATNLPGDDERAAKLLARLNELRRICRDLGYAV